jgi:hypothetical protein
MHDLELTDILSRFLTQRSHINWDKCAVRTSVFSEKHPKGFSVFHTTGLTDKQIQEIAHQYVINDPTRPLRGHFELEVAVYEQAKLSIKKSEPPTKALQCFWHAS